MVLIRRLLAITLFLAAIYVVVTHSSEIPVLRDIESAVRATAQLQQQRAEQNAVAVGLADRPTRDPF